MKTLIATLILAAAAHAQTTLMLSGPTTVRPGQQAAVSLSTAGDIPAGLQWGITFPAGWSVTTVAGAASTTAAKTLYCNTTATLCLVVGINSNTISDGEVAKYTVTIPANAVPGLVQIPLSGLVAAALDGTAIAAAAGTPYTVTVLAKSDLNGDGKTDILDLQLMAAQITGTGACSNDQNGDGKCDLVDALLVIRAALGL